MERGPPSHRACMIWSSSLLSFGRAIYLLILFASLLQVFVLRKKIFFVKIGAYTFQYAAVRARDDAGGFAGASAWGGIVWAEAICRGNFRARGRVEDGDAGEPGIYR